MKFKKNNKGFSLVELIIVIAIMVALVAVLAPQFTKYVEKSRLAVDTSAVDDMLNSAKTIAVDPDTYDAAANGFVLTWTGSDGKVAATVGGNANTTLQTAVDELIGTTVKAQSKDMKSGTLTITYNASAKTFAVAGVDAIAKNFPAPAQQQSEQQNEQQNEQG